MYFQIKIAFGFLIITKKNGRFQVWKTLNFANIVEKSLMLIVSYVPNAESK